MIKKLMLKKSSLNSLPGCLFETIINLWKTHQNKLWNPLLYIFFNWDMKRYYLYFIKKIKNTYELINQKELLSLI
jgi:hypothetical protein